MPDKHLSSQFDADLNSLSSRLLEMGGLVESQISTAMRAFTQMDIETCNIVIQNEKLVNDLEIQIDMSDVILSGTLDSVEKMPVIIPRFQVMFDDVNFQIDMI